MTLLASGAVFGKGYFKEAKIQATPNAYNVGTPTNPDCASCADDIPNQTCYLEQEPEMVPCECTALSTTQEAFLNDGISCQALWKEVEP